MVSAEQVSKESSHLLPNEERITHRRAIRARQASIPSARFGAAVDFNRPLTPAEAD